MDPQPCCENRKSDTLWTNTPNPAARPLTDLPKHRYRELEIQRLVDQHPSRAGIVCPNSPPSLPAKIGNQTFCGPTPQTGGTDSHEAPQRSPQELEIQQLVDQHPCRDRIGYPNSPHLAAKSGNQTFCGPTPPAAPGSPAPNAPGWKWGLAPCYNDSPTNRTSPPVAPQSNNLKVAAPPSQTAGPRAIPPNPQARHTPRQRENWKNNGFATQLPAP